MYVGSKTLKTYEDYIVNKNEDNEFKIVKKSIIASPAILRIFVEVLSNAVDNVDRSRKAKIPCTAIKVNIDKKTGETSVWNDGDIVPIEVHPEEKIYNHTLIFGHLLTGSNYDDTEDREISGLNGLGGKLGNIFSTKFTVKGLDPNNNKTFEQTWTNNMKTPGKPIVKDSKLKKGYTEVSYFPDFNQFDLDGYTDDIINLYIKYVIDAAMLTKVKVYFNDELIDVNNLESYSKLYDLQSEESLYIKSPGIEVLITPSNEFQSVAFTNGIFNRLGGQHVEAVTEAIFRPILDKFNKKGKTQLSIKDVKQFFKLFVNCTVVNPEFDSQNKEKLESPKIKFDVKQSDINKILKWSVISDIEDVIKMKEMVVLKKSEKKKKGYTKIEGLDQANNAGTKNGHLCSLILCEGLSAKTYAVAGISKGVYGRSGRDWFSILPLRGKCLNVRNSAPAIIGKNAVITDLIQALNLRHDLDYTDDKNFKTLSHGRVILLTDADCFADDTALIIKKNNNISVISIDNLFDDNINIDTQIINGIQVWSDNSWVNINAIRKKKTEKRILTINTYSGLIRCTEDHTFLLENGKEVKSKDIKIGDKLYRNRRINKYPDVNINMPHIEIKNVMKNLQCYNNSRVYNKNDMINCINKELNFCTEYIDTTDFFNISKDEAWVWGLFFADGTCGIYTFDKNREKQTLLNTNKSQNRWKKWVLHHEKKIEEFTKQIEILKNNSQKYGKISKKLRESKKRLIKAKNNVTRISKEVKSFLTRTDYSYNISNCDYEKLSKSLKILQSIYSEYNWTIIEVSVKDNRQRSFKLILNGGKSVENFILNMRNKFYTNKKLKKIPDEILNNTTEIQQSFYDGYYAGDGFRALKKNKNAEGFDILGQVGAQGLCFLTERLGYCSNIIEKKDKPNVFTVHVSKRYRRFYPGEVKNVYEIDYKDRFVYDLETSTGKLNAGIGNIILRQCDGLHISGLIMNFFHTLFPTVLEREEPFLVSMQTPIVRVFYPKGDILFYDENRFRKFEKEQTKPFKSKYYKGLGTTKPEDVPDTFGLKMVEYFNDENANTSMNKVFHKKFADTRKDWLENYNPNPSFSLDDQGALVNMDISNFLNNEVIKFSHNDCKRSIPSLFDGLKESQRKILFCVKKRNLSFNKPSLKVAQLGGYVAEHSNYHHGEQNLYDTVVKMAHDFVGSNNIPLLYRDGMFGTRISLGKDAASARYIFTKMETLTPLLFRDEDDILLTYVVDDGDVVEPEFYIPILPTILINGATGIGSGWSSNIPCFNPIDILESVRTWIDHDGEVLLEDPDDGSQLSLFPEIKPWYRNFEGAIVKENDKYITYGIINKSSDKVKVTELPIGMSTDKFKENCEDWLVNKNIKSMKNYSTPNKVDFLINESDDGLNCTLENMKLYSYLHLSNMVLFNEKQQLKKYTVDQIINDFCKMRYEYYIKRKKYIINNLEKELRFIGNKARFIQEVVEKKLNIMNVDEELVVKELEKRGYDKENKKGEGGYNYLLTMQVRTFTANKIKQLKNDLESSKKKLEYAKSTTEKQMWLNELKEFETEYQKWLKIMKQSSVETKKKK